MLNRKKIIFISDFFRDDINGGAESNDSVLISFLEEEGFEVIRQKSRETKPDPSCMHIVSNFVGLSEENKKKLREECEYIVYEHDHKYLKTRDPSKFKYFKAPPNQVINREFYARAKKVVVLSKVCKEVIQSNLNIDNVHSIGTSLWTEERLSFIAELLAERGVVVDDSYAVLDSANPTKGSADASHWCKDNDIDYQLIKSPDEKEFLRQLANFEKLVFMPQVLETFCRLVAEAKMLGVRVVTRPNMIGMASEDDLWSKSGVELINAISKRVNKALNDFVDFILEEPEEERRDITAILTCYKRPHLLREQIDALKNQSVPPKEIWVWINEPDRHDFDYEKIKMGLPFDVKIFDCNHNWKFYGRFAAAMLADTEYVALFDDDTIPGKDWLSNCLTTMNRTPGILGGVGCVLPGDRYYGHERVGWSHPNEETREVDLVGHAWFFKRDWLQYLWREKPFMWDNGEDIQFSYMAQKYGNIKTYVPPHPVTKPEMHSSLKGMKYGIDDVATSNTRNHEVFYNQRDECVRNAIKNGWKILKERK